MLSSMTAFGRAKTEGKWGEATWELRSVNHRYLELSFRMPDMLRELETPIRQIAKEKLARGKVDCYLRFRAGDALGCDTVINEPLMMSLIAADAKIAEALRQKSSLTSSQIVAWPGLVLIQEGDLSQSHQGILAAFSQALDKLYQTRQAEGECILTIMNNKLSSMREIYRLIVGRQQAALTLNEEKLRAKLTEMAIDVDESRLTQELVVLAQKMDVAEELDRLAAHFDEIERVLISEETVGRRLDFLMQELNRETNTLAAKSMDKLLSKKAVELKVLIEQMREQVQNIE